MYFLISPAKNLNETHEFTPKFYSIPPLLEQAEILMQDVRPLAPQHIAELMHVSDKIALLNTERNQAWHTPFTPDNAKLALYLFNGDVYDGIAPRSLNDTQISYIHNHVRILSGLYGLLRPLDLMQPYRLEMGTALANSRGKNLYDFWGDLITERLNQTLQCAADNIVVNLASQEYFKAVKPQKLNARIITPVFQDEKDGKFKIISFYAKRARGLMVRYAAENAVENVEDLKHFDLDGYAFNAAASSENEWVFQRKAA
ncbi:peroxide stress protein YaaA [Wielerella bovis]|uniref:peroxide stress protein YaaA n=1 Tax=Wielerella bovis TaxID=2917790 RepID=UPI002019DFA2|nr:peroxide stress protein YaaA [Wielerella bovis]ULJ64221.1 peroxide stress protein YaaA [Wielerella bovis]